MCGAQEGSAGGHRQRGARGILEIRRDHDQTRPLRSRTACELFDLDAVRAHRNADQLRAGFEEQALQSGVDGIFDHHFIAGTQQHPRQQIERLLAAVGDDEIVIGRSQILGAGGFQQIAAQRLVSAGRTELQDVGEIRTGHDFLATRAQGVQREELLGGAGGGKLTPSREGAGAGGWGPEAAAAADLPVEGSCGGRTLDELTKLPRPTCPVIKPSDSRSS